MAVKSTGLLTKGIRGEFFEGFADAERQTVYRDWSTRLASNSESESYRWLGTVPQMREWGNGRVAKGLRSESYNVTNLKYEATLEVDRDEIDDDQLGQIRMRVSELADRAATHKDYLIGQLLINGATSGYNSYDGVTFFNSAHVSGDSGSQSNDLTSDITTTTAPTTAEFKESFKQASGAMLAFKDDQGEPFQRGIGGLVVVVHPSILWTALEALSAPIVAQTTNVIVGAAGVVGFPYLSDATYWYLLKTDTRVRPFIFQDREPIEFDALEGPGNDEAFKRDKYLYGVRARYKMTYGYWQNCVRTHFT